jgi:dTDP-4-amino-4,6-dideoxygalactose transaminase
MYYLLMPSLESRTAFIEHLASRGVKAVFHYLPLHLSEFGVRYGGKRGDCPVTEDVSDRLVRLPLYFGLGEAEVATVVEACRSTAVKDVKGQASSAVAR